MLGLKLNHVNKGGGGMVYYICSNDIFSEERKTAMISVQVCDKNELFFSFLRLWIKYDIIATLSPLLSPSIYVSWDVEVRVRPL